MPAKPVILVTGASSGIGEATARLFAHQGYRVALAARRLERLQALAEELAASGGEALPIEADLSKLEDINRMAATVLSRYGQIDILFNNAGFGRLNWLENLDPIQDIEAQFKVNLLGVVHTTRVVLPHMIERRSGHIINMASMAGWVGTPTYSIYAATKFAVRGFSEALRRELGVYGIHVSVIYPGGVATEFGSHTGAKRKTGLSTPAALRLSADDVAGAVLRVARRPKRSLILPWVMQFTALANTLFPGLVDAIIERNFTRVEREV